MSINEELSAGAGRPEFVWEFHKYLRINCHVEVVDCQFFPQLIIQCQNKLTNSLTNFIN